MATLTRTQANTLLADGVTLDVKEAATILMLLERQFDAAVHHRSAELSTLAQELTPLLEAMEARRQQRVHAVNGRHVARLGCLELRVPPLELAGHELVAPRQVAEADRVVVVGNGDRP